MVLVDADAAAAVPASGGMAAWKKIFWVVLIAALVVAADVGGVYWYHAKFHPVHTPPPTAAGQTPKLPVPVAAVPAPPPDPWHGLMAGPITLEKTEGSHLVYAVGKLHNAGDHQRFGVKVELDVFNAEHEKVGTATDYTSSIDPGKEWRFRALVTDRTAATAKLTAVKEN